MLQGTMDNDTNLNGVFRHAWSASSITKVVAQVKYKTEKKEKEKRKNERKVLIFFSCVYFSLQICPAILCSKLSKKLMDQIIQ